MESKIIWISWIIAWPLATEAIHYFNAKRMRQNGEKPIMVGDPALFLGLTIEIVIWILVAIKLWPA